MIIAQVRMVGREGFGCGGRTTIRDHWVSCGAFAVAGYAAGGNRDGGAAVPLYGYGGPAGEIGGNGVGTAKIFLSGL